MNSIERVKTTLAFGTPDRIPLGFYLADCDTIEKVIGRKTYVRNKIAQQIALWHGERDEVAESLKKDTVEFFQKIGLCDVICAKEACLLPPKDYQPEKVRQVSDQVWEDQAGRVYKVAQVSNEFVCVEDPTQKDKHYTPEDFPLPKEQPKMDLSIFEAFDYLLEHLGQERFILGPGYLGAMPKLGGMENGLMEYLENPETVRAAIQYHIHHFGALDAQMVRPSQQGVLVEEDYGTTRASLLSPAMFRDFCFPAMQARVQHLKQYSPYVFLHSCGYTWELIDMFIAAGIDVYQSLQTGAGMDLGKPKDRFDNRIVFWGGLAVEVLLKGTMQEVRQNVRETLAVAKTRKGIILGPSHSIAYGVPYENFMAMLDEFQNHASF